MPAPDPAAPTRPPAAGVPPRGDPPSPAGPPCRAGALPPALRARLLPYGVALVIGYAAFLLILAGLGRWLVDAEGRPIAADFLAFWSAGRMALGGEAAAAYGFAAHKAVQVAGIGRDFADFYGWHNPPHFLFAVIPFALPPYTVGWLLWILAGVGFLAAMLRLVVPWVLVAPLLAAPATLLCAIPGQNGFLTAGLMAGALALAGRRPVAAGLLLGLLTYKPQFGVLFPPLLLLERRWAVILAAGAATLGLLALAWAAFGGATFAAFWTSIGQSGAVLEAGGAGWAKLQSPYALAFRLSGSLTAARIAQGLVLAAAIALLAWLGWRGAAAELRAAALAAAAALATPYVYIYDSVVLTTAAAFLLRDGLLRGWDARVLALAVAGLLAPGSFFVAGSLATPAGAVLLLAAVALRAPRRRAGAGGGARGAAPPTKL